jgi:anti-sigma factor RsiW
MRHNKAERWLAAELGGSLSAARRARLEAHLASCSRCRETRKEWEWVQTGSKISLPSEKDDLWADNLARIRTGLDQAPSGREAARKFSRPVPGFSPWKTWAWGAAGSGVLAAAALLFVLLSPARPLADAYALSFGDHRAFLEEGLASDQAVLAKFNDSLRADLADSLEAVPADVAYLTADNTLSLENLTDQDIRIFMEEIALETGVGEK